MNIKNINKNILLFLLLLAIVAGCREEIISPDNPVSNVNEPVETRTNNSYTFIINADNISFNRIDHLDLSSMNTRVYFNLADYSSGSVEISLFNQNNSIVYKEKISGNLTGSYFELKGQQPVTIIITCADFSGKLKIQLTSL